MIADSISTALETFDSPSRRSTNVIGTSAMRQPSRAATKHHLDEERVAVGNERVERNLREGAPAPAAVAARAVVRAQAR